MPAATTFKRHLAQCIRAVLVIGTVISTVTSVTAQQPTATAARANSYDNAWESLWIAHARQILSGVVKTDGFVLQIGDSISHSRAYGAWARFPTGATAPDTATLQWARAATWGSGEGDVTNRNGWYLAGADTTAWRGMTALSGVSLLEFLMGCCNGDGVGMPPSTTPADARSIIADPTYVSNLHIDTLIAAFSDAQFAVVMLGTNDPGNSQNLASLTSIIDKLEANHIVPILSTIPPRAGAESAATVQFNSAIVQLAQTRALPLIDFYQEVLLRRSGTSWFGTLISADGVHPTADNAGYTVTSNPYLPGGDPATQTTGDALLNVGYLLRTWLTVEKLTEVRERVLGSNEAPLAAMTSPTSGATYTAPATVLLAANASDADGSISRVDFYSNGALVDGDTSSPYALLWANVQPGSYTITARAVDNLGGVGDSDAVTITVNSPTMHVGDLDASAAAAAKQTWHGAVSITVHSASESPVSGAVVRGTWSGAVGGSGMCTTNVTGSCSIATSNINVKKGAAATLSISSLSHPSYQYQASANHDIDGGSSGSSITVQRP